MEKNVTSNGNSENVDKSLLNFSHDELSIILKRGDTQMILEWRGKSKSKNPGEKLVPYFDAIIDRLKDKVAVVDFRKLEYISSSTVLPIIQLIKMLNNNKIKTVLIYDKDSSWQELSFAAFKVIVHKMGDVDILAR